MSKELAFTDDNDVVKYLDTTTAFNLALTADGVAFDLTNAKSVLVKIANDDGYIMQQTIDLTTVTSPLGGTLSFPINQDIMNTLVPDDYDIEVWVTMSDGTQAIFPSDGTLGFSIEENLMSDTGEVIPTITLNDFQQQFDDLSSQMENAVHNVQKGDQGNPGNPGNGIKSANNQYQLSDSPVTVPTGGWSDTILATTDQLPYLWTKIIFIYDDGTTKETNFVSSRGDTGSQGPMGPVGPQGKQGNGLVVRGKADKEENLPTMGNNQGDGYLVGTDLYIWIDGSWQNMGSITPDLADYVKVADMNNALNTKVNVADMRKPASDVAGIEEVNAKQDKIGYTPADDSKVVHDNKNGTITANNFVYDLSKTGITPLGLYNSGSFNDLPLGTVFADATKMTDGPDTSHGFTTTTFYSTQWSGRKAQIAIRDNASLMYFRVGFGVGKVISWNNWTLLSDDSKVAHLSGANNFDAVPTVNNNPLLLASSLPSDLARTGQDNNFTRKLQKSGIDVATTTDVTNAVNTATSNVVTTNKLANFTAGLQKGGIDVATAADLKSVADKAWRQLKEGEKLGGTLLYKIDQSSNRIYVLYSFDGYLNKGDTIADFSSIVNNITAISGKAFLDYASNDDPNYSEGQVGTDDLITSSPASIVSSESFSSLQMDIGHLDFSNGAYFTYDSLK
ncbi:phage baseplate upper protein [Lentilactobacillus kefiri]|uniref:phage baseplate upper protein n=1 Tax=Lentilactobacillus kefiri TaxID=33962 RepID=UPI0020737A3F|nr:phage baseplate upper protein [Lentilactobacillus kefiri]